MPNAQELFIGVNESVNEKNDQVNETSYHQGPCLIHPRLSSSWHKVLHTVGAH